MPDRTGGETITVARADWVASAWLTADTISVPLAGITGGAVYQPALVIVPTALLPPVMPLTCQVTDVLALPVTLAVNCWDPLGGRTALEGAIETAT